MLTRSWEIFGWFGGWWSLGCSRSWHRNSKRSRELRIQIYKSRRDECAHESTHTHTDRYSHRYSTHKHSDTATATATTERYTFYFIIPFLSFILLYFTLLYFILCFFFLFRFFTFCCFHICGKQKVLLRRISESL